MLWWQIAWCSTVCMNENDVTCRMNFVQYHEKKWIIMHKDLVDIALHSWIKWCCLTLFGKVMFLLTIFEDLCSEAGETITILKISYGELEIQLFFEWCLLVNLMCKWVYRSVLLCLRSNIKEILRRWDISRVCSWM